MAVVELIERVHFSGVRKEPVVAGAVTLVLAASVVKRWAVIHACGSNDLGTPRSKTDTQAVMKRVTDSVINQEPACLALLLFRAQSNAKRDELTVGQDFGISKEVHDCNHWQVESP